MTEYTIDLETARKTLGYSQTAAMYGLMETLKIKRKRIGKKAYVRQEDLEKMQEYKAEHGRGSGAKSSDDRVKKKPTSEKKQRVYEKRSTGHEGVRTLEFSYVEHDGQVYVALNDILTNEDLLRTLKALKKD